MKLPTIIKDTREHEGYGYNFRASNNCAGMIVEKLDTGDYAIKDNLDLIVIERKQSIIELCNNFGKKRKQFENEINRMKDIKFKYVVIEDYWNSIKHPRFTTLKYNAILGSIISFELKHDLHFIFAGTKSMAQDITRSLLIKAWKYRQEGVV